MAAMIIAIAIIVYSVLAWIFGVTFNPAGIQPFSVLILLLLLSFQVQVFL